MTTHFKQWLILLCALCFTGACARLEPVAQTVVVEVTSMMHVTTTPVPVTATPFPVTATPVPTARPPTETPTVSAAEVEATPTASAAVSVDDPVEGWVVLAEKDDYDDVGMTNLPIDYVNIERMREVFVAAGWPDDHVREDREFDQETLRASLNWLAEEADANDVVFVYVSAHARYLQDVVAWTTFFADDWAQIPAQRRVLLVDACLAAQLTNELKDDARPYLAIAAVDKDEYAWAGLEDEGLPIIGSVFTYYFAEAFAETEADTDQDERISVQEAALWAEAQQRAYMHDVVFAVPEFLEMYNQNGETPDQDAEFPDVIVDDRLGHPVELSLDLVEDEVSAPSSADEELVNEARVTIVFDNTLYDPDLRSAWGFAAWVEMGEHVVLFDTGANGPMLLDNMTKLGLDPQDIDAVAISHMHGDHTDGLWSVLDALDAANVAPPVPVYVPAEFAGAFKNRVRGRTALVEVTDPVEVVPGVTATGALGAGIIEQALVLHPPAGIVFITGCAHPGILEMVQWTHETYPDDAIPLVMGGFHLGRTSRRQVQRIAEALQALGVEYVIPTHCTGDAAIQIFAETYGDGYIQGGVGRTIQIDETVRF